MAAGFAEMEQHVMAFPSMWAEMWPASAGFRPDVQIDPRAVVLNGMGGSSIGGALLQALIGEAAPTPLVINRTYSVPRWADSRTVSICISYSGNTEETLAAFKSAGRQGAQRICITTGGELAALCEKEGVPFQLIPPGLPPRAALPLTFVPLLNLARHMNLLSLTDEDIEATTDALHEVSAAESGTTGKSDEIAARIKDRIPLIYSGPGLMSAVNLRWRGQIQENAKSLAFGNVYPELNHNEIVGWQCSESTTQDIVVIELTDEGDAAAIRTRMDLTRELLEDKAADWITIRPTGDNRLVRMMQTVLLGDWVSLKLAALKGVDPMPVELIDALKLGLSDSRLG